jgi:phosphoribosyl-AMP cyclohydrolase
MIDIMMLFPINKEIIQQVIADIKFDTKGLVPAIAQDYKTNEILMMAWMNADAIEATLTEGAGIYYSRSRQQLWRKGETSGHMQKLIEFYYDCDKDSILIKVDQTGPACHTNRKHCFYHKVNQDGVEICLEVNDDK